MSLFASLGQGDIWALSGISFASPINDLLDKGEFTLEELLEEDELIQEVKTNNGRLISFLSKDSSVERLLDFIIKPALPAESSLRVFKYPYVSCEVICCEVPELLRMLVEESEGKYLFKLFSFLSEDPKLDYYLAGYFEKILEMLFRRMTIPMMKYFNSEGNDLLIRFLNHMDNYSVMQIVQRLMLPHIPFVNLGDGESMELDDSKEQTHCNWSYQQDSCQLLLDRMFDNNGDPDVALHISDLLITVLQLSPPETFVIEFLCRAECIQKLLEFAVLDDVDVINAGDPFSSAASISLATISVLESLNSRLFESSIPYDQNVCDDTDDVQFQHVKDKIDSICHELVPFLPRINSSLIGYLENNRCAPFTAQSKSSVLRLGHRGLQLVKLIESIVRLGNPDADQALCSSGIIRTCINLMFKFVNNSLLHLSVQRIIISILESENSRNLTQKHLLTEIDLLPTIMRKVKYYHGCEIEDTASQEEKNCPIKPQHSSIAGNLTLIAQALSITLDPNPENVDESENYVEGKEDSNLSLQDIESCSEGVGESSQIPLETSSGTSKSVEENVEPRNNDTVEDAKKSEDSESHNLRINATSEIEEEQEEGMERISLNFRSLVESDELLVEWDKFVDTTLHSVLDHQMVGTYQAATNLSAFSSSQDDAIKLGVDLDLFRLDAAGGIGLDDEDDDEEIEVSMAHGSWTQSKEVEAQQFDPFGNSTETGPFDGNNFDDSGLNPNFQDDNDSFANFAEFDNMAASSGGSMNSTETGNDASNVFADSSDAFADFAEFNDKEIDGLQADLEKVSIERTEDKE